MFNRSEIFKAAWKEHKRRTYGTFAEHLRHAWFMAKLQASAQIEIAAKQKAEAKRQADYEARRAAEDAAIAACPILSQRYSKADERFGQVMATPPEYRGKTDEADAFAELAAIRAEAISRPFALPIAA